jgi:hypothetical protein
MPWTSERGMRGRYSASFEIRLCADPTSVPPVQQSMPNAQRPLS